MTFAELETTIKVLAEMFRASGMSSAAREVYAEKLATHLGPELRDVLEHAKLGRAMPTLGELVEAVQVRKRRNAAPADTPRKPTEEERAASERGRAEARHILRTEFGWKETDFAHAFGGIFAGKPAPPPFERKPEMHPDFLEETASGIPLDVEL